MSSCFIFILLGRKKDAIFCLLRPLLLVAKVCLFAEDPCFDFQDITLRVIVMHPKV
jgi:hypothetical protein